MNIKNHILSEIKKLTKIHKDIKVSYSYHKFSNTHSVEILPSNIYHTNPDLKNWEIDFVYDFIDRYPNDGICILTADSLVPIENVEHVFEGELYGRQLVHQSIISSFYEAKFFDKQFLDTFQMIFATHSPLLKDNYTFKQKLENLASLPSFSNFDFNLDKKEQYLSNHIEKAEPKKVAVDVDNTYPLAA